MINISARFIKWIAVAAMLAGGLYLLVQVIHPADTLASVTTMQWRITHILSLVMDMLALIAITGIYALIAHRVNLFGFIGYILFSLFWALIFGFHFIEAFVFPVLAATTPQFVEALQGLVTSHPGSMNIGIIPVVYTITGISYIIGGLLFGIAIFRSKVLPKWAGGLLAIGAIVTIFGAVIPHPANRVLAIPMGIALVWIGWAILRKKDYRVTE